MTPTPTTTTVAPLWLDPVIQDTNIADVFAVILTVGFAVICGAVLAGAALGLADWVRTARRVIRPDPGRHDPQPAAQEPPR